MAETMAEIIQAGGDITTTLTEIEEHQLRQCEKTIQNGLSTFLTVGRALATIRDNRLYRATHDTFERYCKEAWDLSKSKAYYQIAGYETVNLIESKMSTIVDISDESKMLPIGDKPQTKILPINEAQTRPLTKLKDPDDQIAAWDIVLQRLNDGEKLTAALIAKAVKQVSGEVVKRNFAETKESVGKTNLVSNQFARQAQVMLDLVNEERNQGWRTTSRKEAINIFKKIIKLIEEDV